MIFLRFSWCFRHKVIGSPFTLHAVLSQSTCLLRTNANLYVFSSKNEREKQYRCSKMHKFVVRLCRTDI